MFVNLFRQADASKLCCYLGSSEDLCLPARISVWQLYRVNIRIQRFSAIQYRSVSRYLLSVALTSHFQQIRACASDSYVGLI